LSTTAGAPILKVTKTKWNWMTKSNLCTSPKSRCKAAFCFLSISE
jgi:hypothetical protein